MHNNTQDLVIAQLQNIGAYTGMSDSFNFFDIEDIRGNGIRLWLEMSTNKVYQDL